MKYTFEAYKEDGSPRKWIGTFRPPRFRPQGYVFCTCNVTLQTTQQMEDHYQMGHFDSPLYEDDE